MMAMTTIKTKTNHYIGKKGAQTLYYAAEVAQYIHCPLNYFVTINFKETDLPPLEIHNKFLKIKRKLTRWMKNASSSKEAFEPTFAWVFENCKYRQGCHEINDDHNIHVHWAMHIPEGYEDDVLFKLKTYLKQETSINDQTLYMGDTMNNPNLSYFLKGCHPDIIETYGRGREASDQGVIPGNRRTGTTRNIAPKARKKMDKKLGVTRSFPKIDYVLD